MLNQNLTKCLTYNEDTDYFGMMYNGVWHDILFASLQWDGYIFNRGVYDNDRYATPWGNNITPPHAGQTSVTNSMQTNRQYFNYQDTSGSTSNMWYATQWIMQKKFTVDRPCKVKVLCESFTGDTPYFGACTTNSVSLSGNSGEVKNSLVNVAIGANIEKEIDLSHYVGQDVYFYIYMGHWGTTPNSRFANGYTCYLNYIRVEYI
jgi:hypothetical protein